MLKRFIVLVLMCVFLIIGLYKIGVNCKNNKLNYTIPTASYIK